MAGERGAATRSAWVKRRREGGASRASRPRSPPARSRRPGGARVSFPALPRRQGTVSHLGGRPGLWRSPSRLLATLPFRPPPPRALLASDGRRPGGGNCPRIAAAHDPSPFPARPGPAAGVRGLLGRYFHPRVVPARDLPYPPPPAAPRTHALPSRSALPSLPASFSRRSILGLTETRELPGPGRPRAGVGRAWCAPDLRPWSSSPGPSRGAPRRASHPGEGRPPYQAYAAGWVGKPRITLGVIQ